ncbi:hypothetical protein B0H19DRAFT_1253891 [Mycena capillaripes]|nr:hypothetical protein B0H19DRAFT_1253891 [Mycena capillaripes]
MYLFRRTVRREWTQEEMMDVDVDGAVDVVAIDADERLPSPPTHLSLTRPRRLHAFAPHSRQRCRLESLQAPSTSFARLSLTSPHPSAIGPRQAWLSVDAGANEDEEERVEELNVDNAPVSAAATVNALLSADAIAGTLPSAALETVAPVEVIASPGLLHVDSSADVHALEEDAGREDAFLPSVVEEEPYRPSSANPSPASESEEEDQLLITPRVRRGPPSVPPPVAKVSFKEWQARRKLEKRAKEVEVAQEREREKLREQEREREERERHATQREDKENAVVPVNPEDRLTRMLDGVPRATPALSPKPFHISSHELHRPRLSNHYPHLLRSLHTEDRRRATTSSIAAAALTIARVTATTRTSPITRAIPLLCARALARLSAQVPSPSYAPLRFVAHPTDVAFYFVSWARTNVALRLGVPTVPYTVTAV